MGLPEDFISWSITGLLVTVITIFVSLIISRKFDTPETGPANAPSTRKAQLSIKDAAGKTMTYRLRGVPSELNQQGVKKLVQRVLALEDDIIVGVESLADDPSRRGAKIATLEFSKTPSSLSKQTDKAEWEFSTCDNKRDDRRKITLLFDTHFRGLTPLHSRSDADCTIE